MCNSLRSLAYILFAGMLILGFSLPRDAQAQFELQLLHASDLEGGTSAIEDAPRFSAVVEALRSTNANTLVLSSGDNYIPGPFFNASNDDAVGAVIGATGSARADIAIMNAIGFNASAIGNHEFDAGSSTFAGAIEADGAYPGAQFPYLSSNLDIGAGSPLASFVVADAMAAQANSIAGSVILDVNGEQVGVIGATTPILGTISSPDGNITITPADPNDLAALAAIIQAQADALTAAGVNKIILVSHLQQFANETTLATLLSGIDIIVAGGSDTRLADSQDRLRAGDVPQGDYPTIQTDVDGNPVAVVSTDGNYSYVGRLVVGFDANGVIDTGTIDEMVSGAFATDEQGVTDLGGTANTTVQAIVDAISAVLEPTLSNVFGKTDVFLNGTRGDVRTQETNLGNLTADANLAAAQAFDANTVVSLKNGGGIRADIGSFDPDTGDPIPPLGGQFREDGEISQLDIENTLRFNNALSLLTVTAAELLAIVEHGVAASGPGQTPGRFPQIGGMAFSFDPALPPNNRVRTLVVTGTAGKNVRDVVAQDGSLVGNPARTFRMVTLNFLADGGDGYPFPATGRVDLPDVLTDAGTATFADPGTEQDALAEYLAATFTDTPFSQADVGPEQDRRIQNLSVRGDALATGPTELPPVTPGLFAFAQFIHNVPDAGPVDVYVNDERIIDDLAFQNATAFTPLLCPNTCKIKLDITAGDETNNDNPVFTSDAFLNADVYYAAIALGVLSQGVFDVLGLEDLRPTSRAEGLVEYTLVHGVPGAEVDIRRLDSDDPSMIADLLVNNWNFGDFVGYWQLTPGMHYLEVTTSDNSASLLTLGFDVTNLADRTFILLASPTSESTFTLVGFDALGNRIDGIAPRVLEATPSQVLAVAGNYPNPFNPSTTIRFNLAEPAAVHLEVIDVLGRTVMTLPRQRFEAGAGHAFNVDASALASGTYLYRVIAQTATGTRRHTGLMILSK